MKTQVLIIGGGATGTGVARDLALRGVKSILIEQQDLNHGASGANHGLLHSGARYVEKDMEAAQECRDEGQILKKLDGHCIDDSGGLFIAVEGDDENYIADFPNHCERCGLPCEKIDVEEALELEPTLSKKLIAAYKVDDASIDPFKLSLENTTHAEQYGSSVLRYTKASEFKISNGKITSTVCTNTMTGEETIIEADVVVNASGAWAGIVAQMAGASMNVLYSKGTLLITHKRMTKHVINRLGPAADADILVPGGTVSILGTTSRRIETLDEIRPTVEEVDFIIDESAQMVPSLESVRYIRAYAGVRPLIGSSSGDDRNVSRGFTLLDHLDDGLENFVSISGGKLTTYRFMAEKVSDMVCDRLGVTAPCITRTEPLPSAHLTQWTEPGLAPKKWLHKPDMNDMLLCECEMVPTSAIDTIINDIKQHNTHLDLKAIGLRSRVGKGSCQGSLCGIRVTSYMYDRGDFDSLEGLDSMHDFLNERWKGERPILWGMPIIQSELTEALHCGFFGFELEEDK